MQHLWNESNLDYLFITESWLHANSATPGLSVPRYNILEKTDLRVDVGGDVLYKDMQTDRMVIYK